MQQIIFPEYSIDINDINGIYVLIYIYISRQNEYTYNMTFYVIYISYIIHILSNIVRTIYVVLSSNLEFQAATKPNPIYRYCRTLIINGIGTRVFITTGQKPTK